MSKSSFSPERLESTGIGFSATPWAKSLVDYRCGKRQSDAPLKICP